MTEAQLRAYAVEYADATTAVVVEILRRAGLS
jgi:hypothetical protein